jgi:membrane protein
MLLLQEMLPDMIYPVLEETIYDILSRKHAGLISLGFFFSLWFSSSMFIGLINSFNQSINLAETRTPVQTRVLGVLLMLGSAILMIIAIGFMVLGQDTLLWLTDQGYLKENTFLKILPMARWFLLAFLIYITISVIYFTAPVKRYRVRFFSVGSIIATLFFVALAWGFGLFVKYFSAHNALYGCCSTSTTML